LLKLATSSTARARHESWKKRQFEAPHNSEPQAEKLPEKSEEADGVGAPG